MANSYKYAFKRSPQAVRFGSTNGKPYVQGFCYKNKRYMTFVGSPALKAKKYRVTSKSGKEFTQWLIKLTFPNEAREQIVTGFYGEKGGSQYIIIPSYDILLSDKSKGGSVVLGASSKRKR